MRRSRAFPGLSVVAEPLSAGWHEHTGKAQLPCAEASRRVALSSCARRSVSLSNSELALRECSFELSHDFRGRAAAKGFVGQAVLLRLQIARQALFFLAQTSEFRAHFATVSPYAIADRIARSSAPVRTVGSSLASENSQIRERGEPLSTKARLSSITAREPQGSPAVKSAATRRLGSSFSSARTLRAASITSCSSFTSCSASGSDHCGAGRGKGCRAIDRAFLSFSGACCGSRCHNSSVRKGINGCSSRSAASNRQKDCATPARQCSIRVRHRRFDPLDIPIAKIAPEEVIDDVRGLVKAEILERVVDRGDGLGQPRKNPAVREADTSFPAGYGAAARTSGEASSSMLIPVAA